MPVFNLIHKYMDWFGLLVREWALLSRWCRYRYRYRYMPVLVLNNKCKFYLMSYIHGVYTGAGAGTGTDAIGDGLAVNGTA
jgi:hypothetical protein